MKNCFYILFLFLHISCVEEIDVSSISEDFTGILIIEANITDVEKKQIVLLSRMQKVESDSTVNVEEERLFVANGGIPFPNGLKPILESDAVVRVEDDKGNSYDFTESSPGVYESVEIFKALPGTTYNLAVKTKDNQEYASNSVPSQSTSKIDNIYAERLTDGQGREGVGIFADASFDENKNKLLRYTYEETYKIIAPQWTAFEFDIIRSETEFILDSLSGDVLEVLYPDVQLVPRAREERVCYKTDPSSQEILVDVNNLSSNSSTRNLVRFISRENPILSHRYSILLKQYLVSTVSFQFYERLKGFSSSASLFSQVQPGSLEGNVLDVNGNTQVIGYFDVSSEVSTRLFFNYEDFFPGEDLPKYFGVIDCDGTLSPPIPNPERDGPPSPFGPCPFPLVDRIDRELVEYFGSNFDPPPTCEGPYLVVNTICGDCNVVGTNIKPEFWIE